MKTCSSCRRNLSLDLFHRCKKHSDGHSYTCKECISAYVKANRKHINALNRAKYDPVKEKERTVGRKGQKKETAHEYYLNNQERIKRQVAMYSSREEFKKRRSLVRKIRRENDPAYRILNRLRVRLYLAIRSEGTKKAYSTLQLVGCPIASLKEHLQSQFRDGMSWENIGKWHIDHIKPCASFDLSDPTQQLACFHYKNLQPLWAKENLRKHAKVINDFEMAY